MCFVVEKRNCFRWLDQLCSLIGNVQHADTNFNLQKYADKLMNLHFLFVNEQLRAKGVRYLVVLGFLRFGLLHSLELLVYVSYIRRVLHRTKQY